MGLIVNYCPWSFGCDVEGPGIGLQGRSGDQATLAEARKRFEAHCKGESTIPVYLRAAVYSTVLRHGVVNTLRLSGQLLK